MENIFRIELNLFGVIISLIVIWVYYNQIKNRQSENKIFMAITYATLVELILDSAFWQVDGMSMALDREINIIINTIYYMLQLLVCYLWSNYCLIHMKIKADIKVKWLMNLLLFFGLAMLIVNVFTGVVFSVDASNIYLRTWGLWGTMQAVCCIIFILISICCTVWKMYIGDKQIRADGKYLLMVSVVPVISMLIQMRFYGLNFIWAGMSLALLLVLIEVELKQYQHLEKEFAEQRIQIMLSQIQPHFLYNSLNSIQSLCKKDPLTAEQAIRDFSLFLRANMDSLGSKRPIPFTRELEHVKNYLKLERLRFGEQLNIEYDIEVEDFFLPALTLQPIVENAVKYGVGGKDEGGTVTIITREDENEFYVVVIDDGVGFNAKSVEEIPMRNDGRTHIGLSNVKNRLERISNGTLEVDSATDEGTTMTIRIPKI